MFDLKEANLCNDSKCFSNRAWQLWCRLSGPTAVHLVAWAFDTLRATGTSPLCLSPACGQGQLAGTPLVLLCSQAWAAGALEGGAHLRNGRDSGPLVPHPSAARQALGSSSQGDSHLAVVLPWKEEQLCYCLVGNAAWQPLALCCAVTWGETEHACLGDSVRVPSKPRSSWV